MSTLKEKLIKIFTTTEDTWTYEYTRWNGEPRSVAFSGIEVASNLMQENKEYFQHVQDSVPEYANIQVNQVEHYGGEEQGTEYYTVYKFTEAGETVYARFDGYYQSHYGTDYQSWHFVKPVQRMITAYEKE